MDDAFAYLEQKQNGGIDTEAAYPYKGRAGTCAYKPDAVGATINGYVDIPPGNESALLDAVATVGPVAVAVDAAIGWQLYHGGIMHPVLCSSKQGKMDHGVTVVGFGTEKGKDYWIIKNSWGPGWGEKGFLRLLRGKNACGVANAASYPKDIKAPSNGLAGERSGSWQWQVTVDVFEGVLQGFFGSSEFPHLKACASEAENTYEELAAAVGDLEKMTAAGIKDGLEEMATALKGLKTALADCKASSADLEKFAATVEHGFAHPLSFLFHLGKELLVNHVDIFREVSAAVADWKAQSYRAAGEQIGAALGELLEHEQLVEAPKP